MIVAKCPLRIPLAGGSTDLQDFIDAHGYGAVVSFPANLYTYITLHKNNRGKYIIDYTKREEVDRIQDIKNDVAREVLREYTLPPITITFNTDAHSSGSGLASSSSFLISLLKAVTTFKNINMSNFEICKKALEIERRFNPLTGYQDPYGCGLGSLKLLEFYKDRDPAVTYLDQSLFEDFDMFLIYTGRKHGSTSILKKTMKTDRRQLVDIAKTTSEAITKKSLPTLLKSVNIGWEYKKTNSPHVMEDSHIQEMDTKLVSDHNVIAHRLCGAGNRGYFFVMTEKNLYTPFAFEDAIKIGICQSGAVATKF